MFNYERDYSQANAETDTEQNMENSPVIPQIKRELACERKSREFVVEALLFAIVVAISAWPILGAVEAMTKCFSGLAGNWQLIDLALFEDP
jgi:hypothetical protein